MDGKRIDLCRLIMKGKKTAVNLTQFDPIRHLGNYTVRNNFRCGIGKARSGKIPIPHRKYRYPKIPMWYRYFRCGIGISDVV
jgi:hypothetical protein